AASHSGSRLHNPEWTSAEQVNVAIDRGSAFPWGQLRLQIAKRGKLGNERSDVLACYALVHSGLCKRDPECDAAVREFLMNVDPRNWSVQMYEQALLCMLIESYGDASFY